MAKENGGRYINGDGKRKRRKAHQRRWQKKTEEGTSTAMAKENGGRYISSDGESRGENSPLPGA
jgi:hypothetical protein